MACALTPPVCLLQPTSQKLHLWNNKIGDAGATAIAQALPNMPKLEKLEWFEGDKAPMSATQLVGEMEVLVPMAGLIDKDAELKRLDKELERLNKEIGRLEGKLNNEKFTAKAPAEVVEKEKEKLKDAQGSLQRLSAQRAEIEAM
mgnify:CR=1 FL=1